MDRKLDRERIAIYSLMVGAFNYKTKAFNETSRPRQRNVDGMISLQLNSRLCFEFCILFLFYQENNKNNNNNNNNNKTKTGNQTPYHSSFSGGDHLRSTSGIICGLGSFAVQFGDHFRSWDHLRSGIICCAVQCSYDVDCVYLARRGAVTNL